MTDKQMNWFKQLFHNHQYKWVKTIDCQFFYNNGTNVTKVPVNLYECKICGHRKVVRESNYYYKRGFLTRLMMWENRELDAEELD